MNTKISNIANKSLNKEEIDPNDAKYLLSINGEDIYDLFYWANKIRFKFFGNSIVLCAILSAKQGNCSEDCKFCAQSKFHKTEIPEFPLVEIEKINDSISRAKEMGAASLGLVTSGYSLNNRSQDTNESDFEKYCDLVKNASGTSTIPLHASVGCMTEEMAVRLAESGVEQINHNLETSRNLFPNVCTTHSYEDRVRTIKNAQKAGLKICSGGIFGIGESPDDILDMIFSLRELDVDTIPLNFLNPIPGSPFENCAPLKPMEILKIVSFVRFVLPDKEIKIAGGRETNLRDLQSWMFYAGANSAMIGDYLTTKGKPANEDLQMIKDLGLVYKIRERDERGSAGGSSSGNDQ